MRTPSLPGAFLVLLSPATGTASIEGYVVPCSVAQGGTVSICVSTDVAEYDVQILRIGARDALVYEAHDVPGFSQAVPDSAWEGCNWIPSLQVPISTDWPSGVYKVALIPGSSFGTRYAMFTVFEDLPGSTGAILLQNSAATWQAYNSWGGHSLYDLPGNPRAHVISFQRPYTESWGMGCFVQDEEDLVRWLESEGFGVEYCTERELHTGAVPLVLYDLLVIVGHCEYVSKEMRDGIEAYVAAGGNVAVLGGNTCWWQIRFDQGVEQIVCYKEEVLDPLYGFDDERVTVRWHEPPVNRPANHWTGASLLHGGDPDVGNNAYTVWRPNHWVFEGTGIVLGEEFGEEEEIAGREVDGADLVWVGGLPEPTGSDGTPPSFEILATSPASFGWATMGMLQEGGTVFNASSISWGKGLATNAVAQQVTRNVIEGLVEGDPYAPRVGRLEILGVNWGSVGSDLLVTMVFRNRSEAQTSRRATIAAEARQLGGTPINGFDETWELGPLLPGEVASLEWNIPADSLPPAAERLIAGGNDPVAGCFVGSKWPGQLRVEWSEAGTTATYAFQEGQVDLPVCPNASPSSVRLAAQVQDDSGGAWSFSGAPSGWQAILSEDASGVPGEPAPNPLPPGSFDGWISVSADETVPVPASAEIRWRLMSGADTTHVQIDARSCDCLDPTSGPLESERSLTMRLYPPLPNPAHHEIRVRYELASATTVRLTIHDIAGRTVRVLLDREQVPGLHALQWDLTDGRGNAMPAGVYFLRLAGTNKVSMERVAILR